MVCSCKEENMSTSTSFMHPQVRLGVSPNGWKPDDLRFLPGQEAANVTFPYFGALPAEIQARIFRIWLQKDRTIHCFSRLDPFAAPASWPVSKSASGMYNRFYWGEERLLNLKEDTVDPQQVLRLLLVSKGFYFKGVHAFYGLNTFAFSSIGEFGRFCKGIGRERAARLQHVELTWTGSQYLTAEHTFSPNKKGKQVENWDSVRTRPFAFLLHLRRLRTLSIFLNESDPLYERRKYESPETKAKLLGRTEYQPNFRKNRCLRTLHGLDYVYALRGLDWVRLYDVWAMNRDLSPVPGLRPIRDNSFVADVNSAVTMRKSADESRDCELQSLPPICPAEEDAVAEHAQAAANPMRPWNPSNADWSIVQQFYNNPQHGWANVYGPTRTYYGVRDLNAVVDAENGNNAGPANGNIDHGNDDDERVPDGSDGRSRASGLHTRPSDGSNEEARRDPGRSDHGTGSNSNSLFVDDDDNEDDHPGIHRRPNVQAGPSRQQRPTLGPARRPERPALQPRSAAELNAGAGASGPGTTAQKRPSQGAGRTPFKRQRQATVQLSPAQREQQARDFLGQLASSGAIARLLNPFAANLKGRDWDLVKRILEQGQDARDNQNVFEAALEAEGKQPMMKSSANRIASALRN
jgi:hypothetical protein